VVENMGDGVLAIFQQSADRTAAEACGSALAAANAGLTALAERNQRHPATPLNAGIALHYGKVSYGNIGSGDRLDFTVIGPDVNMTARIERFCRELDRSLITSEAFADTLNRPMWEIGHFELRGFAKMQRLFELPPV
jgi:adenylate cyclase